MAEESPNSKIVALGVSKSYASEIVSGARKPSLVLALRIFRATGLKFGPIAHASDEEIGALERVTAGTPANGDRLVACPGESTKPIHQPKRAGAGAR